MKVIAIIKFLCINGTTKSIVIWNLVAKMLLQTLNIHDSNHKTENLATTLSLTLKFK